MILNNNPAIEFEKLAAQLGAVAAELRTSGAIERNRKARAAEENSPEAQRARFLAIRALLDRADDLNHVQVPLPRIARLPVVGMRPAQFLLRFFNYLFRQQRELNEIHTRVLREVNEELERLQNAIDRLSNR